MTDKKPAGKAIGGLARAEALEPERRREIAQRAAAARWGLKATHKGNFKKDFGVDVECYVLGDATKTAVISQRGMARALGFGSGGQAFPRFLNSKAMVDALGTDLREKLENPVKFQWSPAGPSGPPPITLNGFDAGLLIDICNAVIAAETKGNFQEDRHKTLKQQSHIIVGASAKAGIKNLVYALVGYSPSAQEVIDAFKLYIQEEARKYESEFPPELYMAWHKLYQIPVPVRGKPWHFRYLTVHHIYYPLAQSSGSIYNLLRALRAEDGDRKKKLFQFLNEIGARALRMHLGRVLEMAESSPDKEAYERRVAARFGRQSELDLVLPDSSSLSVSQSTQSQLAILPVESAPEPDQPTSLAPSQN